ncbi:2082_t:CDS:2 [Funneliformis geosporum]|nr:2082_t:CDS:2 [Funneliformis geosporum]
MNSHNTVTPHNDQCPSDYSIDSRIEIYESKDEIKCKCVALAAEK